MEPTPPNNPPDKLDPGMKKMIDASFALGTGLDPDLLNTWGVVMLLRNKIEGYEKIQPIRHFHEYVLESPGPVYKYVMEKSDPEKIKEFDALVDEFNADLERIKKEKDQKALKAFLTRAVLLVRGKAPNY